MNTLNAEISDELGTGFEIGHSFFTPTGAIIHNDDWYKDIINFEIIPLLEEYYFDDSNQLGAKIDLLK